MPFAHFLIRDFTAGNNKPRPGTIQLFFNQPTLCFFSPSRVPTDHMSVTAALLTWTSSRGGDQLTLRGLTSSRSRGTKLKQPPLLLHDHLHYNQWSLKLLYPKNEPDLKLGSSPLLQSPTWSQAFDKHTRGERLFTWFVLVPFTGVGEKQQSPNLLCCWFDLFPAVTRSTPLHGQEPRGYLASTPVLINTPEIPLLPPSGTKAHDNKKKRKWGQFSFYTLPHFAWKKKRKEKTLPGPQFELKKTPKFNRQGWLHWWLVADRFSSVWLYFWKVLRLDSISFTRFRIINEFFCFNKATRFRAALLCMTTAGRIPPISPLILITPKPEELFSGFSSVGGNVYKQEWRGARGAQSQFYLHARASASNIKQWKEYCPECEM